MILIDRTKLKRWSRLIETIDVRRYEREVIHYKGWSWVAIPTPNGFKIRFVSPKGRNGIRVGEGSYEEVSQQFRSMVDRKEGK